MGEPWCTAVTCPSARPTPTGTPATRPVVNALPTADGRCYAYCGHAGPADITATLRERGCLYELTDKVVDTYEDDVPAENEEALR